MKYQVSKLKMKKEIYFYGKNKFKNLKINNLHN